MSSLTVVEHAMKRPLLLFLGLVIICANVHAEEPALERLRAKIPVSEVKSSVPRLVGRYTSASRELGNRIGGFLSGYDLYLFPDGTFVYCEWADVEPVTIHDKGVWKLNGSVLQFASDVDVKWTSRLERNYLAVRRDYHHDEVVLVGLNRGLPAIEGGDLSDPNIALLIDGLLRAETYTAAKAKRIKAQLLKVAWRPEYFKGVK